MTNQRILEAKNITKNFPGVLANDHVDMHLNKGEILAILGENGAGKTTLLNIIYGLYDQDEGEIYINGRKATIDNPHDAINQGIGMVHQHFMLVPVFTVTENMILGSEVETAGILNLKKARRQILELSDNYGLNVDPDAVVEDIPVGVQQRVEILKALYRNARILILDEPTAVLTPQEIKDLFRVMRDLTDKGVSIIFISHKLKEVMEIADRIVVMRRGKVVGETRPNQTNQAELANMMVGREVLLRVEKEPAKPKEPVFRIENLSIKEDSKRHMIKDVTLTVRAGEILGVAGVQGNGQTELVEAITGLRSFDHGAIILDGKQMPIENPRALIESGMAHIPEDRQKHGLVMPYPLTDNLILCTYYRHPFVKGITRNDEAIEAYAERLIEDFDVRTPSPFIPASNLSGGNQQKLIVARELSRETKILIANQPTRGLDVGSIEYIHSTLIKMRDNNVGILLVSAELDEIMSLSDRIAVIYEGEIVATLDAKEATREELGLLMAGSKKEHSQAAKL
ncbi:MAG: ABC transporter ATP-binding protein [Chloroflexota bacterium]|jgi:simple sugar transport system ATP-binding protein|nr:ABC transporter ATP-binding protein [Chloroflexota bacterium]